MSLVVVESPLAGDTIGRLQLLELKRCADGRQRWECRCVCGASVLVKPGDLREQKVQSCGCLRRDLLVARARTHGESSGSPEWTAWRAMLQRCLDSGADNFHRYGGRGIRVCEEWRSYERFLADMGRKPTPAHSIDRIDNDGDYEPGNCRWATRRTQGRNRSSNRVVTWRGETRCLLEWAEVLGINYTTLHSRLRRGMTVDVAFGTKRFGGGK